ncbi:exosortase system-associated protein, TIGR04073 family [Maridesulfovibrio frigidus]|uniref:exosortase system-associated protein, TIGR04073 family n=1 Tax=Maridesulfovibrio frigidus TaxID=340956 RepID=UPI0004E23489|nr:exosortase system-associated protein, TIGR04073 family [Maridesulfovibrio frigidus]
MHYCKQFAKIMIIVLSLAMLMLSGCSMKSDNYVGSQDSYGSRAPRKLGRGMTNVVTSLFEIPNQAVDMAAESDGPAEQLAGYFGGFFVGVAYSAGRVVSGTYDIVTSPFGGPAGPTMDDEFITSEFAHKTEATNDSFLDVTGMPLN